MGSGRVEELAEFVQNSQVELVIFDHELSPAQQKNLENALGAAVIDRTTLILDIFASACKNQRGQVTGGAGAAEVPSAASGRTGHQPFPVLGGGSAPAVPAKASWKVTADTSAAGYTRWKRSWRH